MSTKSYDSALDIAPSKHSPVRGVLNSIVEGFAAIREGIELAGEYKELTGRGVSPSEAARQVFEHIGKR